MTAKTRTAVRFARQYTTGNGNVFMRFETTDDRAVEVNTRAGRSGLTKFTRREAKFEAMRRLGVTVPCPNGCPDDVVPGAWIDPEYCAKRQAASA